ncbi:hypothetical protein DYB31_006299 [Aphanomyces astaci]|uniref:C2 domain-containing protein n=1 Tax=Aphanomyces astaci TaxID=112090 RepID=A0A397FGR8_APHAT|nr:hypothetical protein DYB31_006299 [Aphanomyces astaci]
MYTKLAMIEETLKRKEKEQVPEADSPGTLHPPRIQLQPPTSSIVKGGVAGTSLRRDVETERFIHELRRENAALRKKTQAMTESSRYGFQKDKQKVAASKKKGPVPVKHQSSPGHHHHQTPPSSNNTLEGHSSMARAMHHAHHYASSSSAVAGGVRGRDDKSLEAALKARMVTAERHVVQLHRENADLKESHHHHHNNNNDGMNDSVEQLQRELRDRQAQLVILNARFDNLESKAMAEREIQEKTLEQMDNFNRVIHRLRSELQEAHMVRDDMEKKVAKAKDMREELEMLRAQNHTLEERMTSLCESPFINDAFQRKERIDKLVALESQTKKQQHAIDALQAEGQKHVAVIQELQANIRLLKQAKDGADQELLRVKQLLDDERLQQRQPHQVAPPLTHQPSSPVLVQPPQRQASSKSTSPMHQQSPPSNQGDPPLAFQTIPPRATGALPLVLRRGIVPDDPSHVAFLEGTDSLPADNSVAYLRHKVHTLQIAHLTSTQELERCEKMLQAQTSINRELTFEIEELVTRKDAGHVALRRKLDEVKLVADTRLRKVAMLEAQLRQLKYMRSSGKKTTRGNKHQGNDDDDEEDLLSLGDEDDEVNAQGGKLVRRSRPMDLLADSAVDLAAGENLLEIWIVGGDFDSKYVNGSGCTFVLCDFFDFESQSTSLVLGSRPAYNFAASFKITADAFFLRYLASESLALEVHQAVKGDFHVVGRTSLRLSPLLVHSSGALKDAAVPVRHVTTNATVGRLHLVIRVALPLTEIWQLHLQACPSDGAFLTADHATAASAHAAAVDLVPDDAPLNDLQVSMVACRKLLTSSGIPPSAYVHYQLLGFPDVFTDIVPNSGAPTFSNDHGGNHWFTLAVDPCLKQFFKKVKLRCTIFDDNASSSSGGGGVLGSCDVPLRSLVDGDPVDGWFDVVHESTSSSPAIVGELLVHLSWKHPFQLVDQTNHKNALTQTQVHDLMVAFSPLHDGRVNYRAFLAYAHASVFASALFLDTIQSIQAMLHGAVAAGRDVPSAIASATSSTPALSKDAVARAFHAAGLSLPPDQVQVLIDTLGDVNGFIHPVELWRHVQPTPSCQDRFVAQTCRDVVRRFELTERQPSKVTAPFERYDPTHCQYVSRAEFKRGLGVLGFVVYDPEADQAKADLLGKNPSTETRDRLTSTPQDVVVAVADEAEVEVLNPKTTTSATTEFEQRKAAFTKRMKQAADASCKTTYVLDAPQLPSLSSNQQQPLPPSRAARVIQQRFRAYRQHGTSSIQRSSATTAASTMVGNPQLQRETILDVEAFLAQTLTVTDDLKATLVRACQELDHAKRGRLSRKQMTFALRPLCLTPPHLRCLLDAFRTDGRISNGQTVEADMAPFAHADGKCDNVLPFDVFQSCLKRKCPHLSSTQVNLVAQLFDVSGFGVHYRAFFEYMASTPMSVSLQKIKASLRSLSPPTKQAIQVALAQVPQDESLTKLQLSTLWKQHNVELTPADQSVLWAVLDPSRLGTVSPTSLWTVLFQPSSYPACLNSGETAPLDLSLLQQLSWNSRRYIAPDSDAVLAAFTRYDWAKTGGIGVHEFAAVVQQLGFIVTSAHASQQLARHFYSHGHVQYSRFLQWSRGPDVSYPVLQTRLQHFVQNVAADQDVEVAAVVGQWRQAFPPPPVTRHAFASIVAQPPLALPLNAHEIRAVLYHLDPDCHDVVDVHTFLRFTDTENAPDDRPRSLDAVAADGEQGTAVLSALRSVVAKARKHDVLRLFQAYDGSKQGVVEPDIFVLVWRKLGVDLQPPDVHWIFAEFAKDGHRLAYRKFLRHHLQDQDGDDDCDDDDDDAVAHARRLDKRRALLRDMLQTAAAERPDEYAAWRQQVRVRTKGRAYLSRDKALSILAKSQANGSQLIDMPVFERYLHVFENVRDDADDNEGNKTKHKVCMAMLQACLDSAAPLPPPHETSTRTTSDGDGTVLQDSVRVLGMVLRRCVEQGVDYRRAIDRHDDPAWSGLVTPAQVKASLMELGFNVVADGMRCIGSLIGAFRFSSDNQNDAINYIQMMHAGRHAADLPPSDTSTTWQVDEALRARVRQKCHVTFHPDGVAAVCAPLARAFGHFDRDDVGYLTLASFTVGLHALHYHPSAAETQALFDSLAIFRLATPAVVSRVEFDAWALDPHRHDLLAHLHSRIASFSELSHALAAADPRQTGELPVATFGDVLATHGVRVSRSDLGRLQYLFDVNRTGTVLSYKLWLRVVARSLAANSNAAINVDDMEIHDSSSVFDAVHRTLKTYMIDANTSHQGGVTASARACMEAADASHGGVLAVADFFLTMKHMGLVLAPEQVRELVLRYPGGADKRQIDYRALLADAAPVDTTVMQRVMACIEDALERGVDVLSRLRRLDTKGHGTLTAAQFRVGLEELGAAVRDADMPLIMAGFGGDSSVVELRHVLQHARVQATKALLCKLEPLSDAVIAASAMDRATFASLCASQGISPLSAAQCTILDDQFGACDKVGDMIDVGRLVQSVRAVGVQSVLHQLRDGFKAVGCVAKDLGQACLTLDDDYTGQLSISQFFDVLQQVMGTPVSLSKRRLLHHAPWVVLDHVNYRAFVAAVFHSQV